MATAMKHVGAVGDKPCVVLFREVPSEPDNCLVIKTGTLSDQHHDALMNVVQSAEAQEANDISEVLNRRQFPDGENMLTSLHQSQKIEKVAVSLVSLTPTPSTKVALAEVNAEIRKLSNNSNPPLKTEVDSSTLESDPILAQAEQAQVVAEANAAEAGDPEDAAAGLIMQATLLEEDAKILMTDAEAKRAEAYRLNPELEPKRGPGRPRKTELS